MVDGKWFGDLRAARWVDRVDPMADGKTATGRGM
jgi:hypothetical protein